MKLLGVSTGRRGPEPGLRGRNARRWASIFAFSLAALIVLSAAAIGPRTMPAEAQAAEQAGLRPQLAPLNPDYVAYVDQHQPRLQLAQRQALDAAGISPYPLGYVPAPVDLSYLAGRPVDFSGALPAGEGARGSPLQGDLVGLPATYDLRSLGRVTPVRNQQRAGTCWDFASIASLESNLTPSEAWDFSENNLKDLNGFDVNQCYPSGGGGNQFFSSAYLARWDGPVNESDDPYDDDANASPLHLPAQKHVQDIYFIPPRANSTDNDRIKQAVMAYGALYTSFDVVWADFRGPGPETYYYNGTGSIAGGHAVAIVGWDDAFSRNNFATRPPGDGAFIAKNSWGSGWGDAGYFYVSYYDIEFGRSDAVAFTAEPASNYDYIYQHDPLGDTGSTGYGANTAWMAANYTAAGKETLNAVGFYALDVNTDYLVNVYRNGALVASANKSGTIAMPGYHTVPLDNPVGLSAGNTFQVRVRLHTTSTGYPIAMEAPWGYSSRATASPGQSYISSDGAAWTDLTSWYSNTDVCLKAYTDDPVQVSPVAVNVSRINGTCASANYSIVLRSQPAANVVLTPSSDANITIAPASLTFTAADWATPKNFTVNVSAGATGNSTSVITQAAASGDAFYNGIAVHGVNVTSTVRGAGQCYLDFGQAAYAKAENGGNLSVTVQRQGNASLAASATITVAGGNATQGADYSLGATSVSLAPGVNSTSFNVTMINDAVYEGNETIVLSLTSLANATPGTNASTTVTIAENDAPPVVQIASAAYTVAENGGRVTVALSYTGSTALATRVGYATANGNATAPQNYTSTASTATFAAGNNTYYVDIPVVDNAIYDYGKFFYLNISSPANATLGATTSAKVSITENDAPPVVQIASATYTATENGGKVTIALAESGQTALLSKVNYATANGNATAGQNYTAVASTIAFAPGNQTQYVDVPILDNSYYDYNKFFYLNISAPANCTLGGTQSATVTIVENDPLPSIAFYAAAYSVSESAGRVTIRAQRTGNTAFSARANYATANGNATAGANYTAVAGTLTFPAGNGTQYFDVPVTYVPGYNANAFFFVNLSGPVNATLGAPAAARVWINNVDAPPIVNYTIGLVDGWNLISLPLVPQDGSLAALLPASVTAGLVDIWGWDESAQNWIYYSADSGDYFSQHYPHLTQLQAGRAYWFEMNRTASFTEQGYVPIDAPASPAALVTGWNFVGPTGVAPVAASALYPAAADVWGWDEGAQNWNYYTPGAGDYFSQHYPGLSITQPGHGYWVEKA